MSDEIPNPEPTAQVAGMLLRVYGVACLNITLSLYILQYIRRIEFADTVTTGTLTLIR